MGFEPLEIAMLHRLEFHAMGCEMLAVVEAKTSPALLACVPQWFEEWEQVLSRFRFDSELTLLNQTHGYPVPVSQILWDVIDAACKAEELTNGLVTPTLLNALIEAGYDRSFDELPYQISAGPVPAILAAHPLTAITMDPIEHTITLPYEITLDLGGVAKGWAAHQAMLRLQAAGPALIDAGGDIAISNNRTNNGLWLIGIADPWHENQEIELLNLKACGVATSGKNRRKWLRDGILQHHIIDPFTNLPAQTDLVTVTVIAPNVLEAEAAAKAAFILGSYAGLDWIEAHPQYAAVFVLENGRLLHSKKMGNYLYGM